VRSKSCSFVSILINLSESLHHGIGFKLIQPYLESITNLLKYCTTTDCITGSFGRQI
jgi:hypothetical protein